MTLNEFISGDGGASSGVIPLVVQPVVNLIFAVAVFFFLWSVFKMITKSDQSEELAKFKSNAVWGIVAIAVMASVWGLVAVIVNSTGLDNAATIIIETGQ